MSRREKALPECAEPDCPKDALIKGRWCAEHAPRRERKPCDAQVRRGDEIVSCGDLDTIELIPHWCGVTDKLHRCASHRTTAWLRAEFRVSS